MPLPLLSLLQASLFPFPTELRAESFLRRLAFGVTFLFVFVSLLLLFIYYYYCLLLFLYHYYYCLLLIHYFVYLQLFICLFIFHIGASVHLCHCSSIPIIFFSQPFNCFIMRSTGISICPLLQIFFLLSIYVCFVNNILFSFHRYFVIRKEIYVILKQLQT